MAEETKLPMFVRGGMAGPGRPKNLINKNRLVGEVLNKLNFEPLREAVELYRDIDTPPKVKSDIVLKIMRLVYPEMKQIQMESHSMANAMNPIAEAMLQIQERKTGFDYNSKANSGEKETTEPSTSN
jgi:hypothetical protein|tara:strand:- start:372 stop:752 length:381 start_codon:yes stop_codon:yes gene_type:complete